METIVTIFITGILTPGFGIMSLIYSIYLLIRKKPSSQKQLFISNKNMYDYTKRESLIFAIWGIDIIAFWLLISNVSNQLLVILGVIILVSFLFLGYYLRIKNDKKYLEK